MDDNAKAEALRIAERWLISKGWKYDMNDVGMKAKEILTALNRPVQ